MKISGRNGSKKKLGGTNMFNYSNELGKLSEESGSRSLTHSLDMGIRYYLFFLAVMLYNLVMVTNLTMKISDIECISLIDFRISMSKHRWAKIMNDRG